LFVGEEDVITVDQEIVEIEAGEQVYNTIWQEQRASFEGRG
jgi:hypothetical protein